MERHSSAARSAMLAGSCKTNEASPNVEVFGKDVRRDCLPPPSAGNLPSVQKLRARNTRLPLAQAPQEAVSRGVIRLSTPIGTRGV